MRGTKTTEIEECLNETHTVTVKAGTMVQLPVALNVLPCTVRMDWMVASNSAITFSVEYKLASAPDGESKPVIRPGTDSPRRLELEFKNPGVCLFSWDNSSSLFWGKEITYTVVLEVPKEKLRQFRLATRIQAHVRMAQARKRFIAAQEKKAKENAPPEPKTFHFVEGESVIADVDESPAAPTEAMGPLPETGAATDAGSATAIEDFEALTPEALRSRISEMQQRHAELEHERRDILSQLKHVQTTAVYNSEEDMESGREAIAASTSRLQGIGNKIRDTEEALGTEASEESLPASFTEVKVTVF